MHYSYELNSMLTCTAHAADLAAAISPRRPSYQTAENAFCLSSRAQRGDLLLESLSTVLKVGVR
jgi:hypothetical protein